MTLEVSPIVYDDNSPRYKVIFHSYILYSVVNESYGNFNPDEVFEGNLFRIYKKSAFVDYVAAESFATSEYPGPFKHYCICGSDHIINIASQDEPIIEKIR